MSRKTRIGERCCSQGVLLQTLGFTLEEVRRDPQSIWSEDGQRVNDTVQTDLRWLRGKIAFFEATHRASLPGEKRWWHSIGAPIAEAGAMLWEGVLEPDPNKFWVKLHPSQISIQNLPLGPLMMSDADK